MFQDPYLLYQDIALIQVIKEFRISQKILLPDQTMNVPGMNFASTHTERLVKSNITYVILDGNSGTIEIGVI